jgi:hypothetical protein
MCNMKKLLVILIILCTSFSFSGCLDDNSDSKNKYENIVFEYSDAEENSSYLGYPDTFDVGEPVIKIYHANGSNFEWSDKYVEFALKGDPEFGLRLLSINDIPTNQSNVMISKKGDTLKFGVMAIEGEKVSIPRGSYGVVYIFKNHEILFRSPDYGICVI